MTPVQELREELKMMPRPACSGDIAPERTCAVMAAELHALAQDIAAARRRAHRTSAPGLGLGGRPQPPDGERVRLARCEPIAIRPIRPDDAGRLQAADARLGALTRYRRFLTTHDHLTAHQLAYLTRVDHVAHEALVALDPATGAIVGVARYVCDPADPHRARVAAVVDDRWQGRGVGTALLERLAVRARANDVMTFTGATAAGNQAARRLVHHGTATTADENAGALELTVRLDDVPIEPPPPDRRDPGWAPARPVLVYAAER